MESTNGITGIERELVGAYFRDVQDAGRELRETLTETLDYLTTGDFYNETAGDFFGIIRTYAKERGELPTLSQIADRVRNHPRLKTLEYHAIIAEYMEAGAVTSVTVESDRERIKDEANRRAVKSELSRGLDKLKDPANNPAAVYQSITHAIEQELDKGRETVIKPGCEIWFKFLEEIEKGEALTRIPTGLETLDEILGGGYRPKTLNIIAARPGEGKSAMMLQQARAAARAGFSPLIFSLEMDGIELIERHYRQTIGRNPHLVTAETGEGFFKYLDAEPFEVIDTPMDIDEIEVYCLQYHRKYPSAIFYIDYLGIIRKTKEQANLTAVDFLDELTRRLKTIAKRTGAAVILLAQLNRDSINKGEPPKISQLRGSGGIEQNADTITLIWNPESDNEQDQNNRRNLKLAKNRQGAAGKTLDFDFSGERTLFTEPAPEALADWEENEFSFLNSGGFEN